MSWRLRLIWGVIPDNSNCGNHLEVCMIHTIRCSSIQKMWDQCLGDEREDWLEYRNHSEKWDWFHARCHIPRIWIWICDRVYLERSFDSRFIVASIAIRQWVLVTVGWNSNQYCCTVVIAILDHCHPSLNQIYDPEVVVERRKTGRMQKILERCGSIFLAGCVLVKTSASW